MIFPHLIVELVWPSNICLLDDLVAADGKPTVAQKALSDDVTHSVSLLRSLVCLWLNLFQWNPGLPRMSGELRKSSAGNWTACIGRRIITH